MKFEIINNNNASFDTRVTATDVQTQLRLSARPGVLFDGVEVRRVDREFEEMQDAVAKAVTEAQDLRADRDRVVGLRDNAARRGAMALTLAHNLVVSHDISRDDPTVQALLRLGMDGFTKSFSGTVTFTVKVSWEAEEVDEDVDGEALADAIADAIENDLEVRIDGGHADILGTDGWYYTAYVDSVDSEDADWEEN